MQYQLFVAELRDRNEDYLRFLLQKENSIFLPLCFLFFLFTFSTKVLRSTAGLLLTKVISFTFYTSRPYYIIHSDMGQPESGANARNYSGRDTMTGYFCPLGVETKGWPFRSKSGT